MALTRPETLPQTLPVFPLAGVILLPGGSLPLNVFEPRYLAMVDDALKTDRLIGIIQPRDEDVETPPLYATGCAGRITSFAETDNGKYLVTLTGLCRFEIEEELESVNGYRCVRPDWRKWTHDLDTPEPLDLDRDRLVTLLQNYFSRTGLCADWESVMAAPAHGLVTTLAMVCPFEPPEKQALLETAMPQDRLRVLMALLEIEGLPPSPCGCGHH